MVPQLEEHARRTIHKNLCHKAETLGLEMLMEGTSKSILATDAEAPMQWSKKEEKQTPRCIGVGLFLYLCICVLKERYINVIT